MMAPSVLEGYRADKVATASWSAPVRRRFAATRRLPDADSFIDHAAFVIAAFHRPLPS